MLLLTLLAQALPEAVGNPLAATGWASFGLTGLLLSWLLLKHLPEKDRQIKELIDGKDAQIRSLMDGKDTRMSLLSTEFREELMRLQAGFKESLITVVAHCERETTLITQSLHRDIEALSKAIDSLSRTVSEMKEATKANRSI